MRFCAEKEYPTDPFEKDKPRLVACVVQRDPPPALAHS
jgi:hypothetical protein